MRQKIVPNISKTSKKFLTKYGRYGIIHIVRNEASNKVSKINLKKLQKSS